jgi:hypothetical protein
MGLTSTMRQRVMLSLRRSLTGPFAEIGGIAVNPAKPSKVT